MPLILTKFPYCPDPDEIQFLVAPLSLLLFFSLPLSFTPVVSDRVALFKQYIIQTNAFFIKNPPQNPTKLSLLI